MIIIKAFICIIIGGVLAYLSAQAVFYNIKEKKKYSFGKPIPPLDPKDSLLANLKYMQKVMCKPKSEEEKMLEELKKQRRALEIACREHDKQIIRKKKGVKTIIKKNSKMHLKLEELNDIITMYEYLEREKLFILPVLETKLRDKKQCSDQDISVSPNTIISYSKGIPIIHVPHNMSLDEAAEECAGIMKLHNFDYAKLIFHDVKLEMYPYTTINDLMIEYVGKIK